MSSNPSSLSIPNYDYIVDTDSNSESKRRKTPITIQKQQGNTNHSIPLLSNDTSYKTQSFQNQYSGVATGTVASPTLDDSFLNEDQIIHKQYRQSLLLKPTQLDNDPTLKISQSFESLDYTVCENLFYRNRNKDWTNERKFHFKYWVILIVIGFFTGVTAFIVDIGVTALVTVKFGVVSQLLLRCESPNSSCIALPMIIYIIFNLCLSGIAAGLVVGVSNVASGSGIPKVKAYLNGTKIPRLLRFRAFLVKAVGVLFAVSSGLPIGKEGPMMHCGAIIAAGVSQGKTTSLGFDSGFLTEFRTDHFKRDFVASGSAAGIASAFASPVGGFLMSHEEPASFWDTSMSRYALFCSMVSAFFLNLFLSGARGYWGELNNPGLVYFGGFGSQGQIRYTIGDLPVFIGIGLIGGLFGATFNHFNKKITLWRQKHIPTNRPWKRFLEVVILNMIISIIAFSFSILIYDCHAVPDDAPIELTNNNIHSLFCPSGHYNDMATIFFSSSDLAIKQMYHNIGDYSLTTLATFFFMYISLACVTYGIAVPSGLFIPSMLSGAAYGRFVGILIARFTGLTVDPGTYALVGSASMLGGAVRMAVALTVILVETTNDISYLLPILLTLLASKWVGDFFNPSIYEIHIELMKIPFLESEFPREMHYMNVEECVGDQKSITLTQDASISTILRVLRKTTHSGFPVVVSHDNPRVIGMVLRYQLIILLSKAEIQCFTDKVGLNDDPGLFSTNFNQHSAAHKMSVGGSSSSEKAFEIHSPLSTSKSNIPVSLSPRSSTSTGSSKEMTQISTRKHFTAEDIKILVAEENIRRRRDAFQRMEKYHEDQIHFISFRDFVQAYPRYPKINQVPFFNKLPYKFFDGYFFDLRAVMNPSPYTVPIHSYLAHVYRLFRTMGLRHIIVVDSHHQVSGIITRHDLWKMWYHYHKKSH